MNPTPKRRFRKKTVRERLLKSIVINSTTGCWEWKLYRNAKGYGSFAIDGHPQKAHRVSYEEFKGPIPDGLFVCHDCDNPCCINPDHLTAETPDFNVRDMLSKSRGSAQRRRAAEWSAYF